MTFSLGQSEYEHLSLDVLGYERSATGQYEDDNWLRVTITVHAGGFRGKANASIMTDELVRFAAQLPPLYETLTGAAEFNTLEGQLHFRLNGDGKGHIDLDGEIVDRAGLGNRLRFTLELEQSQLAASIRQLDAVITAFPVRST